MLFGASIKGLTFGILLLSDAAWSSSQPVLAADDAGAKPARGGIQISGERQQLGAAAGFPQHPGAVQIVPRKKRARESGHADDLRTQGDIRRDTFRLLLGGR